MTSRPLLASLLAAVLCLAPDRPAVGQETAHEAGTVLTGTVRALDSGDPLGGATVRLLELGRQTTTGSDGGFEFSGVPEDSLTVEITALGRLVERRSVHLRSGEPRSLEIALAASALDAPRIDVVLDRFRVVGEPEALTGIPGSAHVLGPEELNAQKQLYDDIHTILRQVPGITIQEEDAFGLRPNIGIRGTGSERSSKITVMEDGVLIAPAPYSAPSAYYFPVAGRMEAIEIRKGSSQIKYGPHTIGGALNLISSPIPGDLTGIIELEGGQDRTGKAHLEVGNSYEHFGWLAETYQIRTDGFKRLDGGGDTGFEIGDYLVKLRVNADPDAERYHELELKLGRYDQTSNETYLGLTEADFASDPYRRYPASQQDVMDAEQTQVQLRHFARPVDGFDITTVLYRNDFDRNWYKLGRVGGEGIEELLDEPGRFANELAVIRGATSAPDALEVTAGIRSYYGEGVQSIAGLEFAGPAGRHEIELGGRYHADEEDRFQHADLYQMVDGRMVRTTAGAPGSGSNQVSEARAWAYFAQDRVSFGRWTVTPGLRLETIDFTRTDYGADDPGRKAPSRVRESDVTAWIPGIGATFAVTPSWNLFGGVHKGFGPPGPGAEEETEPEESVNYELGARYDGSSIAAQVVGFYNDYENILGKATLASGAPTGAGELFNGGAVDVTGLELSIDFDPLAGLRWTGASGTAGASRGWSLPVRLAYTYTDAEFRTSFESDFEVWGAVEAGDELPYLPEHQLHASLGLKREPWSLRLEATHVDEMRTVAGSGPVPEGEGTDPVTVWGLSGQLALNPWSSVFAGVQNLTEEAYVVARHPAGARPGLPRTLLAGVRIAR
ncbi:MAG TPA: TonB-dependent receptor [Gemmatimonadota bacterium]|nr:TonB-dependent receptor [Gemmatimonadota bacterium]